MKRRILILISVIVVVGALASYGYNEAVYHVLPYSAIRPHRMTQQEVRSLFRYAANFSTLGLKMETFNIFVEDTIQLDGWFVHSATDTTKGTIILLHGIASCKEALLPFADTLAHHGYNCILYDSRANGESGGINCTFGYYEKYDVSTYINQAYKRFGNIGPVGIFGSSMGAAVAIQAMAVDKRIVCGIVESPFSTMRDVIYEYWKEMFFLPFRFIPNQALKVSEKIANFSVDSVNPEHAATLIRQPVLVVHGDRDEKIPTEESRAVFDSLKSPDKEWRSIIGGHHNDLSYVGGPKYLKAELNFLRAHLK